MNHISPYGDGFCNTRRGFHQKVKVRQYPRVENQALQGIRRKALQRIINDEHGKNVSAFARTAKKPQAQIADMLAGRKAFGEKVARSIERNASLIPGILDRDPDDPNRRPDEAMIFGAPITAEAAQIGREWAKLNEPVRGQMATLIMMIVAAQIREARTPGKPRRSSSHASAQ